MVMPGKLVINRHSEGMEKEALTKLRNDFSCGDKIQRLGLTKNSPEKQAASFEGISRYS